MLMQDFRIGSVWGDKIKNKSHYDTKDEFARLDYLALIVHCLLVVGEQGSVLGGAGQS